jgi:hypothetical protein
MSLKLSHLLFFAVLTAPVACSSTDPPDHAGGGGAGALCETFCETVQKNCTGENTVYQSLLVCKVVCNALPPGQEGDQLGNTVQCRLTAAENAAATAEPAVNCPQAGPGGDGICGENCGGYCTLYESFCNIEDFTDLKGCQSQCASDIPTLGPGTFNSGIDTGNSLECRLYHLSAATLDAGVHCPHAAGETPCVDDTGGAGGGR